MVKFFQKRGEFLSKETKQYKYDILFLFIVITLYMLCVMTITGGWVAYLRYLILPIFILWVIYRGGLKVRVDLATLVLFVLAVVPSIIFSDYKQQSTVKAATVLLMFFACSVYFYSTQQHSLQALYRALLLYSYVIVFVNFIWYLTGQGFRGGYFRGMFGNRNAAGPVFVVALLLFLAESWRKQGRYRLISISFAALSAFLVVQTQSRGAFLGAVLGVSAFLVIIIRQKFRLVCILGLIALIVILFWGPISQIEIVQRIIDEGVNRDELWGEAARVIQENPLVGVGFASSEHENGSLGAEGMNFHNSYVSMMADVGIFGVTFLIGLFVLLFIRIIRNFRRTKGAERLLFGAFFAVVIAFFGLSFGESYLLAAGNPSSFVFWCIMFCLAQCKIKSINVERRQLKM